MTTTTANEKLFKRMMARVDRDAAVARLRELFPPGSVAYTVVKHVSRSGMLRVIDVLGVRDGKIVSVWGDVARAVGMTPDRDRGGVRVRGCGMDMGFHLVYEMSARLYLGGFGCVGEGCRSNDHSNGDWDYTPHVGAQPALTSVSRPAHEHWHQSGGYALRHHRSV